MGSAVDPPVVEKNGEVHLVYKGPTKCEKDTTKYLELHFRFSCAYGSLVSLKIVCCVDLAVHVQIN